MVRAKSTLHLWRRFGDTTLLEEMFFANLMARRSSRETFLRTTFVKRRTTVKVLRAHRRVLVRRNPHPAEIAATRFILLRARRSLSWNEAEFGVFASWDSVAPNCLPLTRIVAVSFFSFFWR